MLAKKWYTDKKSIEFEIDDIFKKNWIYVGLDFYLKNNNDFVTIEIGSSSIVVQNFKGKLVAFQNICSHRLKRIQTKEKGNRPLVCEYHGWSYDENGVPRIPKRDSFDMIQIDCLNLKKYKLEVCGKFIFVNLDGDNASSLTDYLGDYYEELHKISDFIDLSEFEEKPIIHRANWKLLVENVLEGYHCPLVHRESLVSLGYCIDYPVEIKFQNKHSSWHSPKLINKQKAVHEKLNFLQERCFIHESFYHIYIFPNLFISSTSGTFFYIGDLRPITENKTNLDCKFFGPLYKTDLQPKEKSLNSAMFKQNVESAMSVILEDLPMVEGCQKGMTESSQVNGILSKTEELRIIEFHKLLNTYYNEY
jgi:phenylpropionate dioxygenase-like ring-hydroxylating dioxygenase large terminal subunit